MTTSDDDSPTRAGSVEGHEADGSLRVSGPDGELVVLNSTAAAIWELFDGQTTVDEVIAAATRLFAGPPAGIRGDIVAIIDDMREQHLLA